MLSSSEHSVVRECADGGLAGKVFSLEERPKSVLTTQTSVETLTSWAQLESYGVRYQHKNTSKIEASKIRL